MKTKYLIRNLATKAALNTKLAEAKDKIPGVINLATKAALNTKTTEIKNKIVDTTDFMTIAKLTKIDFDARIKQEAKSFANKIRIEIALDIAD